MKFCGRSHYAHTFSLSILKAIFLGEPWLASFIGTHYDWIVGDS